MKKDEKLLSDWTPISIISCEVDDLVDLAARNRAHQEDIDEALKLIDEYHERASAFLKKLSAFSEGQPSSQSSSS